MLDSVDIDRLYENVLDNKINRYNLSPEAIKFGISCMAYVYGETVGLQSERSQIADYRDPAHRCAYLHKYAALHTAMVRDMLSEAVGQNYSFFHRLIFSGGIFKMCSLGGGPGTDVIGTLAALHAAFGYFPAAAAVADYMFEWSYSFSSILSELGSGWYGAFGSNISDYLNWKYIGANLLKSFKPDVLEAISAASLVTMVKFTSAAACMDTRFMIKNIFTAMKPGAALLFIDNDGGGFGNLIQEATVEFGFKHIFGPFRREKYMNAFFRKKRFGAYSCCETTVTVHVLQKQFNDNCLTKPSLLGSPPTPYLFVGETVDQNYNPVPTRPPLTPLFLQTSTAVDGPPHTPFSPCIGYTGPHNYDNRLGYASVYDVRKEGITNSNIIYTPEPNVGKRSRINGCFPARIGNFRHHVTKKIQNIKARARAVFKKKDKKKNHPIFKL